MEKIERNKRAIIISEDKKKFICSQLLVSIKENNTSSCTVRCNKCKFCIHLQFSEYTFYEKKNLIN